MKLSDYRTVLVTALTLLLLTSACSDSEPRPGPTPTSTSSAAPAPSTNSTTPPTEPLVAAPGQVGPVEAGMSKADALATGYFDADVTEGDEACPGVAALQWKSAYAGKLDVLTNAEGTIASIGIWKGIATQQGITIGDTLGEINDAYGDLVSPAQEAGYGQTGVFVTEGDKWLGFLIDDSYTDVSPASKLTFMEVTTGMKPSLIRDGC